MTDPVKSSAEVIGTVMSLVAMYLTGQGRRSGPLLGMAAFVPWAVFAVCTHSWVMLAQNILITGIHGWNLAKSKVFARGAPTPQS